MMSKITKLTVVVGGAITAVIYFLSLYPQFEWLVTIRLVVGLLYLAYLAITAIDEVDKKDKSKRND